MQGGSWTRPGATGRPGTWGGSHLSLGIQETGAPGLPAGAFGYSLGSPSPGPGPGRQRWPVRPQFDGFTFKQTHHSPDSFLEGLVP